MVNLLRFKDNAEYEDGRETKQAMLEMVTSAEMEETGKHRAAGLAGQLNIETVDASGLWLGQAGSEAV